MPAMRGIWLLGCQFTGSARCGTARRGVRHRERAEQPDCRLGRYTYCPGSGSGAFTRRRISGAVFFFDPIGVGIGMLERFAKRGVRVDERAADRYAYAHTAGRSKRQHGADGRRYSGDDLLREPGIVVVRQNDDEFIAAESRDRVLNSHAMANYAGENGQRVVARRVTPSSLTALKPSISMYNTVPEETSIAFSHS